MHDRAPFLAKPDQGSVLSCLFFIIMLGVFSLEMKSSFSGPVFYADQSAN